MRITVVKRNDPGLSCVVVPKRSRHLAPVMLQGGNRRDVLSELATTIRLIRGEPASPGPA